MEEPNERQALYEAFKKGLVNADMPYFSEGELVEIFDYATDFDDNYVRMETLLLGSRYFPDSEALRMRRGYLYSAFDENIAKQYLKDNNYSANQGVLFEVLQLLNRYETEAKNLTQDEIRATLNGILERYPQFTDEEIIQFTDATMDLQCIDWLKEKMDDLRQHTSYQPTLLYEVAHIYETIDNHADALPLYEELTEQMPFEDDFWMCKAVCLMRLDNDDEAEVAIDYALALAPDKLPYHVVKARLELLSEEKRLQGIERLIKLLGHEDIEDQVRDDVLHLLDLYWTHHKLVDQAREIFYAQWQLHPENKWIVDRLLYYHHPSAFDVLEEYVPYDKEFSEEGWRLWAREFYERRDIASAIFIIVVLSKHIPLTNAQVDLAEYFLLIDDAKNAKTILMRLYEERVDIDSEHIVRMSVLLTVALAKTNSLKEMKNFCEMSLQMLSSLPQLPVDINLKHVGASVILHNLLNILDQRPPMSRKNPFKDIPAYELLMLNPPLASDDEDAK